MKTVNALKLRNKLGEVPDLLEKIKKHRASPVIKKDSVEVLQELRDGRTSHLLTGKLPENWEIGNIKI
ncbi:MAG: hypothetical protein KAW12_02825 [Candidatus Aminicenantes bacterium]|nr:hypothetical protein [Candidatus Aminicenantes bacterium]